LRISDGSKEMPYIHQRNSKESRKNSWKIDSFSIEKKKEKKKKDRDRETKKIL